MPAARLAEKLENASLAARAWEATGAEGGDCGVPGNGGHRGAVADAVVDELSGEVIAVQERAVADEQFGACFEGVEAGGAGPEGCDQVVSVHRGLRR
jgi:hypothetical protein